MKWFRIFRFIIIVYITMLFVVSGFYIVVKVTGKIPKEKAPISESQIDVYNRYILRNCLQELKTLKGGE